ncbi:hypothetical protein [methane-oxidizing endosymbiont of Gigantopelta aegis]|uniref:hypothetical protein n=1 Tax=methane-oxidizing endosymbiont of Gigantopelta aegis TaxID=2794938 RepID=UPI0018DD0C23|nr:hypothetical protein [methane-oxidizing endosymbiont of Gigantopelta aegis]
MSNKKEILKKRFDKLRQHYEALKAYKQLIDKLSAQVDIYQPENFNKLEIQDKAVFDAYLKRFASIQDFLGAKIFPMILELSGISYGKMTEVLYAVEREEIIDSLEHWIELREVRNDLEHDYPDNLSAALKDLKYCVDNFETLESYYLKALDFAKQQVHAPV